MNKLIIFAVLLMLFSGLKTMATVQFTEPNAPTRAQEPAPAVEFNTAEAEAEDLGKDKEEDGNDASGEPEESTNPALPDDDDDNDSDSH